jgi:hypothetical protein
VKGKLGRPDKPGDDGSGKRSAADHSWKWFSCDQFLSVVLRFHRLCKPANPAFTMSIIRDRVSGIRRCQMRSKLCSHSVDCNSSVSLRQGFGRHPSLEWMISGLATRSCEAAKGGGADRDRTDDLMLAKHALSQLSYGPIRRTENGMRGSELRSSDTCVLCSAFGFAQRRLVGLGRFELPTSRLSSARSNQLSYKPDEVQVAKSATDRPRGSSTEGRETRTAARRAIVS